MMGKLSRHFAVGLIIGLLIFPPLPAQAQWVTFDASQYTLQVKKWVQEAAHWVQMVDQHTQVYVTLLEQLTTLKGMLTNLDKVLFKNQEMALLANDIGKILNDSNQIRLKLDSMIRYQIRTLKSMDDRLAQGIFNPDQDMRDLQDYLLYTMGRDARQTVDQMKSYAAADSQLAEWIDQFKYLNKEYSVLNLDLAAKREQLPQLGAPPPTADQAVNIQQLNEVIMQMENQAMDLKKRIDDLQNLIAQRVKDFGLRLEDMGNFASGIDASNAMWGELQQTKSDIQQTMDSLITGSPAPVQTPPQ